MNLVTLVVEMQRAHAAGDLDTLLARAEDAARQAETARTLLAELDNTRLGLAPTYGDHYWECTHCRVRDDIPATFAHTPDCAVTRLRALLAGTSLTPAPIDPAYALVHELNRIFDTAGAAAARAYWEGLSAEDHARMHQWLSNPFLAGATGVAK